MVVDKDYSHKTLLQKLGIKSGMKMLLVNEPEGYRKELGELPKDVILVSETNGEERPHPSPLLQGEGDQGDEFLEDAIHLFTRSQEDLNEQFPKLKELLKKTGMLWISWPKGHCDIRSNLNGNIVRKIGLDYRLVDIKGISVNEHWSALKFVYRLKDR